MATEGNGGLGSSEEVREGQQMGSTIQRVAALPMEDSTQNTFPWLEAHIRGLVCEAFEHFMKSGPVMDGGRVAAFRMEDSTQNTFPWLDSHIRGLVREAFEHFMKSGPVMDGGSSVNWREQIQEPDRRILQLRFQTTMPNLFFVGRKVKGLDGATICVKLIDATTGHVVESGPVSSLILDVVVLAGDFENKDDDNWTWEDFESNVETGREGKGPLLEGDLQVTLKAGVGSLAEFKFTDISYRRSGKFRLGVNVGLGFFQGIRVREATTTAFRVIHFKKDSKEKHVPRALDDDVCKLIGIGKKGHKNLNGVGILKVKDFLWKLCLDPEGLRKILGKTMSDSNWKTLGDHAKKSVPSGKYHVYYADNMKNSGVVFKNMSELCGLIEDGKYYWAETVSDSQKVFADTLKKVAYAKWKDIVEYDGLLRLEMNPSKRACSSQTDVVTGALESCRSGIDQLVSSVFPTAPSGEASENSMQDFEGEHFPNPSEKADGNIELSVGSEYLLHSSQTDIVTGAPESCPPENSMPDFEGVDAFFCDVDPYLLPESSWDPSEQANGTKEVSAEAHGGSLEQGKRLRGGATYHQVGLYSPQVQGNIIFGNLGMGGANTSWNVNLGYAGVVGANRNLLSANLNILGNISLGHLANTGSPSGNVNFSGNVNLGHLGTRDANTGSPSGIVNFSGNVNLGHLAMGGAIAMGSANRSSPSGNFGSIWGIPRRGARRRGRSECQ